MVNLSECMDPKRYILKGIFSNGAFAHTRLCQANGIAQVSAGGAIHMNSEYYYTLCCLTLNFSLVVGISIGDSCPKGHTVHLFI